MNLSDLYQEIILDHGKKPRNKRPVPGATHHAEGYNALCGDQVEIWVKVENNTITDAGFDGCGCAISTASASLLTEYVAGKPVQEVEDLFHRFQSAVTTPQGELDTEALGLEPFECLLGVRQYPNRVKCATLPWHALRAAVKNPQDSSTVTTE